ncbi:hypothetical protein FNF27_07190 [Cafeteria roenbergensis]|uniref:Uncharacterized protein n=2 Tax=Cafeteria roenbergensis TaxID=33653 RepID=A0A5A8DWY4_CAFRO|nr:hypothetical protein FNF27_07190 [Cafeteria roenbergensis]
MESNDSAASSGPGPEDKRAGVGRPVFSPHVWGVFVHGFNAHRWSLGPGYSGKDGKLARVYCHADGPAKGTPRVGTVFGALPELFQGGKQALMVAYRCTHDFEPTARAVLEALAADLESRGLSLADCVVITHSMGGLVVCSALGEALDAAGVGGWPGPLDCDGAGARVLPAGSGGCGDSSGDCGKSVSNERGGGSPGGSRERDLAAADGPGELAGGPDGPASPASPSSSGGGAAAVADRVFRLPRALLMLDPPLNGLSDTACLAVSQGFKHMARAAGRRTGEVLAPGVGVLSGAGVAGAGIQLLSSSMKKGSWLGALAGTALVVGGGAAALWAGTSADVARAGGDAASATAEAMTEAAAERTRRFLAPMVDPTAPRHAALLRRIRRAAVRLGSWLPVLVMSCALPDQAGKGTTQPGFRNLPPDEEALWAALSRSEAHRLCVREVVPKRFRQALGVGPEALVGGNRFCATSGLAGRATASSLRGTAGGSSCAGARGGPAASDAEPLFQASDAEPLFQASDAEQQDVPEGAAGAAAPVASAGPALTGNRRAAMMLGRAGGQASAASGASSGPLGQPLASHGAAKPRVWNHELPEEASPARGLHAARRTDGAALGAAGVGAGAGATAVEAEAGGRAGEGLHRRHRSTGGLDSTIALDRALDAFNRAGDAAAAPAEADAPLRDFARVAPATEEDEAASALRYFLGRGGGAAAADAKEAQEAWLADLVQWSLRTAAKEASAACAAGGGAAGADDCDEPACGFAAMAHHVTSHGTVFMEAEQRAFVQATLESLPLEDASATPDELLRTLDEVRCDLRDDGVEL